MFSSNESQRNINLQESQSTCLTASALLRGGCALGFKSGWTAESQAWHCCRVSCRLTCFWSSCSRLWYTWDRTIMLRSWELFYISKKITASKWNKSTFNGSLSPPCPPKPDTYLRSLRMFQNVAKRMGYAPVYNFSTHTLQHNILIMERQGGQGECNARNVLGYIKSLEEIGQT